MSRISVEEFEHRLAAVCLRRDGRGLPRKRRDQHILFKSITLVLEPERGYSERELKLALETWLAEVGQGVDTDHVSLRRHLVDEGYLSRDKAGTSYRVHPEATADLFEPATHEINPAAVIEKAIRRKEQKKREYLDRL